MLFEELGFTYVGPIDGHNLSHLVSAFQNIRKFRKAVLVHVVTQKGKGFRPAEEAPTMFHGVGPFDPCDGRCTSPSQPGCAPPTYTEVFSRTLVALAERDPRIVAITAAMPEGTGLDRFRDRFPERFFDVGIAEQHAVTFAAGLAAAGWIPVVAIYSTFLQRAYDQIIHDVALQGLPVVFAVDRAGLVGADGPTHHGAYDLSFLRHVPGLTVIAPSDEAELAAAIATAIGLGGPVAVRYPRGAGIGCPPAEGSAVFAPGTGRLRHGDPADPGVLVLCAGTVVSAGLEAARRAGEEGIQASVFDVRYVKPLDREAILDLASRCRGIVTVEENALAGGFGSAVVELLADAGGTVPPIRRLGLPDEFVEHGSQTELRAAAGIDAEGVLSAVRALADRAAKA
jgi:1-deoxy-D-xylulose-5-phosphate synthase